MTTKKNLYYRAIGQFGEKAQMLMAIEEMSELQKAICKIFRMPKGTLTTEDLKNNADAYYNAYEEMADVEIMLEQLRLIFASNKIDEIKKEKLNRLAERLGVVGGVEN